MYGRLLNARMPLREWYDPSPFITTSDDLGSINERGLAEVQEGYICCSGQFPSHARPGSLWLCNICERVWGIPEEGESSWTLTRFTVVDMPQKSLLAYYSYRWWVKSLISAAVTLVATATVFLVVLWSNTSLAVYASFAVGAVGVVITYMTASRWRKMLNQYRLLIIEE